MQRLRRLPRAASNASGVAPGPSGTGQRSRIRKPRPPLPAGVVSEPKLAILLAIS
jgi:hypothetical protein